MPPTVSARMSKLYRASREALAWRAERDLARRTFLGPPVYLLLFLLGIASTPFPADHPSASFILGLIFLTLGIARIWVATRYRLPQRPPRSVGRALRAGALASTGAWGIFCSWILLAYGAGWPVLFVLLATAGIAAGATTGLAPDLRTAQIAVSCVLLPPGLLLVRTGGGSAWTLAASLGIYLTYLLSQLRNQFSEYWNAALDNVQLTERTAELELARAAAEAASRAKSQFLANMSHEIRTPMNGVLGSLEILTRADLPAREHRLAEMAHRSATALLGLLSDILDLSKIEAGRLHLEEADFSLAEVFAAVSGLFQQQAEGKGLSLRCEVDPRVPALLRGDPVRLRQILVNLVGNAVKFTETGFVDARAWVLEDRDASALLRMEVRDTGPGISSDALDRIFQLFAQVDPSTTRRHGGSGLGLAISQQLAELMGSRIQVDSAPQRGARFWFDLALPKAVPAAALKATPGETGT